MGFPAMRSSIEEVFRDEGVLTFFAEGTSDAFSVQKLEPVLCYAVRRRSNVCLRDDGSIYQPGLNKSPGCASEH